MQAQPGPQPTAGPPESLKGCNFVLAAAWHVQPGTQRTADAPGCLHCAASALSPLANGSYSCCSHEPYCITFTDHVTSFCHLAASSHSCAVGNQTAAVDPAACSDPLGDAEGPDPGYDGAAEYGGGGGSDDDGAGEYDHFDAPGQHSIPHGHLLSGCLATGCRCYSVKPQQWPSA